MPARAGEEGIIDSADRIVTPCSLRSQYRTEESEQAAEHKEQYAQADDQIRHLRMIFLHLSAGCFTELLAAIDGKRWR